MDDSIYHLSQFDIVVALFFVGLTSLESINLSFTRVTDIGMRKLSRISSLKSLNLDAGQITDTGLAALTGKYMRGFRQFVHEFKTLETVSMLLVCCKSHFYYLRFSVLPAIGHAV